VRTVLHVHLELPGWLWWTTCGLAVFRLVRLVTEDEIVAPFRRWVARRAGMEDGIPGGWTRAAYFVTCPWCVGFWLAAAVLALVTLWPTGAAYIALVLAWSAAAGLLSERS
jgi:hypothetical protein